MSEPLKYPDNEPTSSYNRKNADVIAEDKADLAAADGKWEAAAQPGLKPEQCQRLAAIATENRERIDDEFYHVFIK